MSLLSGGQPSWCLQLRQMAKEDAGPVTALTGVSFDVMLGRDRSRTVVKARQMLVIALRERGLSMSEIGMALDRDHTTILHYLNVKMRVA